MTVESVNTSDAAIQTEMSAEQQPETANRIQLAGEAYRQAAEDSDDKDTPIAQQITSMLLAKLGIEVKSE